MRPRQAAAPGPCGSTAATSLRLGSGDRQQVVNAYDNSVVETDFFLDSVLKWLAAQDSKSQTAMVYVADHGESLGENNLYLHGLPYSIAPDIQKHVPWITWLSPAMQDRTHVAAGCLQHDLAERRIEGPTPSVELRLLAADR